MKFVCKHLLRIANLIVILSIPIVLHVTKTLFTIETDPRDSFANPLLSQGFIHFCITAAAFVVLLRQKLGSSIYCKKIEGQNDDPRILNIFWVLKLLLWSATGVFILYKVLTNTIGWSYNYQWGYAATLIYTPALLIHLVELLYKWWPVIKGEMTSDHNLALRILFTCKSLLFAGITVRKTAAEKIIYSIRALHWVVVTASVLWSLPSVLHFGAANMVPVYAVICFLFANKLGYHYYVPVALRSIELVFFDDMS